MKTSLRLCLWLFFVCTGIAHAQAQCDRTQVKETGAPDALLILVTSTMSNPLTADCKSLVSVLNDLTARGETGGKKSKKDKPFDAAARRGKLEESARRRGSQGPNRKNTCGSGG